MSMDGIKRDQTEAAIITPEAKPSNNFCKRGEISSFSKNAIAEPKTVPRNGTSNPKATLVVI